MKLRVIVCEVLAREVYHAAAHTEGIVDITLLTQGLHDLGPERMSARLQEEIDSTDPGRYDAVALGYALCSRGAEGIVARDIPIAIPRAHDCITLLLGSRERYAHEFDSHPGTYYCSAGWDERDSENLTPAGPGVREDLGIDKTYEEYVEQYGEENAKYIIDQLRGGLKHYDRLLFIETGLGGEEEARSRAREQAAREGWTFEIVKGDLALVERLISRDWDGDFVVLNPGERLVATHDARIMECERCQSG
ncbi:MAG: DUF1638 domain-containing protein [Planctomycetota bacterium]